MIFFILSNLKDWKVFFSRSRSWVVKGGWAITDQAFFSGANFVVNILLARWLPPKEYGAFAVAFSLYYLFLNFHIAVLTEPMMVFGAGKYREHFRKYLGMLFYAHWGISLLIAGGLGIAAFVMKHLSSLVMAKTLAGLALASPFLLLLVFARRACYIPMKPAWAVLGSAINFILVLSGVFLLWQWNLLSNFSALIVLGTTAGVASLVVLSFLRPQLVRFSGNPTAGMVVTDHRKYGSWNILAVTASWTSGQIIMLLIPIFLGLTANAVVAAVWNLYRPVSLLMQSLGVIILPTFSTWVHHGIPVSELKQRVTKIALFFGGVVALYGFILTILAKPLLHLLYAGKYDEHWLLVGLFGLSSGVSISMGVFISLLKVYNRVDVVSAIWILSAILTTILSVSFMFFADVEGAIFAVFIAYSIAFWYTIKKVKSLKNK